MSISIANITLPGDPQQLPTTLSCGDRIGHILVRFGWRRRNYLVEPALYRIGTPTVDSPVIVTANYKLTLDTVRAACAGLDLWVLVIDTRGINVWCAAGKGTFGTGEIARMVKKSRLADIVKQRRLIVPQLGAPGVAAHRVKQLTGFDVVYGPVRIEELKAFLAAEMRANDDMRRVRFGLGDRLAVIPIELVLSWQFSLAAFAAGLWLWAVHAAPFWAAVVPPVGAILMGTVVVPLALPLFPFRSFVLKGLAGGVLWALCMIALFPADLITAARHLTLLPPVVAFLVFNFTGSTAFTSPSGVKEEIRRYTWPVLVWFVAGVLLYGIDVVRGWLS